jgi:ribosomal protein L40E
MASLYERIHGVRLCVDCGAHEPVQNGDRCSECLNRYLRETRPEPVREAAWLARARQQPHGLAKDLGGMRGAA